MKKLNLLLLSFFIASTSNGVVVEIENFNLQVQQSTIEFSVTTEKSLVSDSICVPSHKASTIATEYIKTSKGAIKILDIIYLNAADASSCPESFDLRTLIRFISR